MKRITLCFVLLLLMCAFTVHSQNRKWSFKAGLFGGYNYVTQQSEFSALPGIPNGASASDTTKILFQGGKGGGLTIGALFEMPFHELIDLQIKAAYVSFKGTEEINEFIGFAAVNNSVGSEYVIHTMETNYGIIQLSPGVVFKPFDSFQIGVGANLGIIAGKTFKQYERLNDEAVNSGITFTSLKNNWNDQSGDIPEASSINFALTGSLGFEIPITDEISAVPEAGFQLPLNSYNNTIDWKATLISGAVQIKYTMFTEPKPIKKEIRDTVYRKPVVDSFKIELEQLNAFYLKKLNDVLKTGTMFSKAEKDSLNDSYSSRIISMNNQRIKKSLKEAYNDSLLTNLANLIDEREPPCSCARLTFLTTLIESEAKSTYSFILSYFEKNKDKSESGMLLQRIHPEVESYIDKQGKKKYRVRSVCFNKLSQADKFFYNKIIQTLISEMLDKKLIKTIPASECE